MVKSKMSVQDVRELSMLNYQRGGDVVYECWDDRDIQERIDDGYTVEDWISFFEFYLASALDVEIGRAHV